VKLRQIGRVFSAGYLASSRHRDLRAGTAAYLAGSHGQFTLSGRPIEVTAGELARLIEAEAER